MSCLRASKWGSKQRYFFYVTTYILYCRTIYHHINFKICVYKFLRRRMPVQKHYMVSFNNVMQKHEWPSSRWPLFRGRLCLFKQDSTIIFCRNYKSLAVESVNQNAKLAWSSFLTCISALCCKKCMRPKLWSRSLISHPRKGKHVENYCSCAPQVQNAYSVFEQGLIFHQDKWLLFQLLKICSWHQIQY